MRRCLRTIVCSGCYHNAEWAIQYKWNLWKF